jgi:uncharacterized protein (DUF1697 family)
VIRTIALLRSVNVGGTGRMNMTELATVLTKNGYADVKTIVQTGNVLFTSPAACDAKLEAKLEAIIAKAFAAAPAIIARTPAEWRAIVAKNPFPDEAENDPAHLVVMAMKSVPAPAAVKALAAAITGPETLRAIGKQLYIVYPGGQGTTKFTGALIERKLGMAGTMRNWNTVLKIAAAAAP